jgi:hypothetical protein
METRPGAVETHLKQKRLTLEAWRLTRLILERWRLTLELRRLTLELIWYVALNSDPGAMEAYCGNVVGSSGAIDAPG